MAESFPEPSKTSIGRRDYYIFSRVRCEVFEGIKEVFMTQSLWGKDASSAKKLLVWFPPFFL